MSLAKGTAANVDGFWSVPASWTWTTVEAVGDVGLGRQRSPENHSGPYMRQYVRAANISWSGWELSDVLSMNFDPADFERFRLYPGDVLLNEGSGSSAEVGKSAIWRGQLEDCCFQNTLLRVQPKAVSPEYLQLYFMLAARSGRFVPETQGVNIFHIGKAGLAKFSVPVPPAAEQRRVVSKLDRLRARSARAHHELDRIPKLIERYKQAILAKAFSGELTADWRQHQRSTVPITSRELVRRPSMSSNETTFEPPFDIPKTWRWLRLPELGELDRGRSRHRPRNDARLFGGVYPFIQTGEVRAAKRYLTQFNQTYSDFGLAQSRLWPIGTVCITIAANIAETAILGLAACFPDSVVGFTADRERTSAEYIEYFIRTVRADLEQFAPATAQKNINLETLYMVRVPSPPLEEQREIVQRLDHAFDWLDKIAIEHARAEHLLPKLDQAILAKAFRGELVPQDPNDEPASELLQRIKTDVRGGASGKRR